MKAHDRGHLERARENRRVIGPAPRIRREAADFRPVDLRGERGRQLVGDEHRRFVELAQQIAGGRDAVAEVHLQASDEVRHVAFPLA